MDLLAFVITLILVMDPFGNIPIFVSLLARFPEKRRTQIIMRELIIALTILVFFLLLGKYILSAMHISKEALGVAGGVVLLLIALRMVFPQHETEAASKVQEEPFIVPLAVPMVAGPSAISYLILSSANPDNLAMALLGLCIAWVVSTFILILSGKLAQLLGKQVVQAIERLMGMILVTVAVQMLLDGMAAFLA